MKKTVFSLVYGLLLVCAFATEPTAHEATTLEDILPKTIVSELKQNGKIEKTVYRQEYTLDLFPRTEFGKEAALVWEASGSTEKPVFYHESLYLIDKKNPAAPGSDIQAVSELFRSLSKLEGVEYYSHTRKKYRELYKQSYVIKSATDRTRVGDPVSGSADGVSVYAFQEDSTFGKYVYRYDYRQSQNELLIKSVNVETLSLVGVKIIDPEELKLSMVITDLGDKLLMYASIQTDVISLSVIENKLKNSFSARVEALFDWFSSEYTKINAAKLAMQ